MQDAHDAAFWLEARKLTLQNMAVCLRSYKRTGEDVWLERARFYGEQAALFKRRAGGLSTGV